MVGEYNRYMSKKKALRKKKIADEVYWNGKEFPYYNNLHQYSKNKIHCSCPLCRAKTKNHEGYNYDLKDLKRQEAMDNDEKNYNF